MDTVLYLASFATRSPFQTRRHLLPTLQHLLAASVVLFSIFLLLRAMRGV